MSDTHNADIAVPMNGAWVIYDYDHGPYAHSLHVTAEEAAREAACMGYGKVGFWPFGSELRDAVTAWESRTRTGDVDEEPIEVGWYTYSGGAQGMVFHLREGGQWSAHFANGTAHDCAWGYIEQALEVWELVPLAGAR